MHCCIFKTEDKIIESQDYYCWISSLPWFHWTTFMAIYKHIVFINTGHFVKRKKSRRDSILAPLPAVQWSFNKVLSSDTCIGSSFSSINLDTEGSSVSHSVSNQIPICHGSAESIEAKRYSLHPLVNPQPLIASLLWWESPDIDTPTLLQCITIATAALCACLYIPAILSGQWGWENNAQNLLFSCRRCMKWTMFNSSRTVPTTLLANGKDHCHGEGEDPKPPLWPYVSSNLLSAAEALEVLLLCPWVSHCMCDPSGRHLVCPVAPWSMWQPHSMPDLLLMASQSPLSSGHF